MCGHGTIGTVTMALENGLVSPARDGEVALPRRAGRPHRRALHAARAASSNRVRITNVASYLAATDIHIDVPGLGELVVDVSYGGNYYAIVEPQKNFAGLESISAGDVLRLSPIVRNLVREKLDPVHPENETIKRRQPRDVDRAGSATRRRICATPCSTATRRSTAARAAPAPRRAWRISWPRDA